MIQKLLSQNPLFVFALESEAAEQFIGRDVLYTGVGKVNAAYRLAKKIGEEKPSIIVNLGSAGSSKYLRESVVCCTTFIQRDMDATMIGCKKYQTPFDNNPSPLNNGLSVPFLEMGICGTGDNFEVGHTTDDYDVIDMEAYSLAYIAHMERIPFLCLKYISDGADETAADDWKTMVHHASIKLSDVLIQLE